MDLYMISKNKAKTFKIFVIGKDIYEYTYLSTKYNEVLVTSFETYQTTPV